MGGVAELLVGLVVLIVGALLGPGVSKEPKALVALVLLLVGLVLTVLGALSLAGAS
jgi:hypothetical protein